MCPDRDLVRLAGPATTHQAGAGAFDIDVVHGRDVERQQLRDEQASDYGQTQRPARSSMAVESRPMRRVAKSARATMKAQLPTM